MKSKITGSLLSMLILSSCVSTVVPSGEINQIDYKVQVGNTYIFKNLDGSKAKFKVLNLDEATISGTNTDLKNYQIEKNQVAEVKKSNTWGTVLIAAGVLTAVILGPAYAKNEAVSGR